MSAPKTAFSCGPGDGENLFDRWASRGKGPECPEEIRTKKFMFMLLFFPDFNQEVTNVHFSNVHFVLCQILWP